MSFSMVKPVVRNGCPPAAIVSTSDHGERCVGPTGMQFVGRFHGARLARSWARAYSVPGYGEQLMDMTTSHSVYLTSH